MCQASLAVSNSKILLKIFSVTHFKRIKKEPKYRKKQELVKNKIKKQVTLTALIQQYTNHTNVYFPFPRPDIKSTTRTFYK